MTFGALRHIFFFRPCMYYNISISSALRGRFPQASEEEKEKRKGNEDFSLLALNVIPSRPEHPAVRNTYPQYEISNRHISTNTY